MKKSIFILSSFFKPTLVAFITNQNNLDKIIKIVHPKIKEKMNIFLKKHKAQKNRNSRYSILLENKINKKKIY